MNFQIVFISRTKGMKLPRTKSKEYTYRFWTFVPVELRNEFN